MKKDLLAVNQLKVYYQVNGKKLWAANDVSFSIKEGESIGLVGESGSGKSTICLAILRLLHNEAGISSGRIIFRDKDLLNLPEEKMRKIRGKSIAMIFQEPGTSLNPVLTIEEQISETLRHHLSKNKKQARQETLELLRRVHISSPEQRLKSYPHQLSGGMQQRVMIAMAISCNPLLLIADEPTSALDSSIEAQIIDLLSEIKGKFSISLLLVSHNLSLVAQLTNWIAVMYAGRIVELADKDEILTNPKHPYTKALLEVIPSDKDKRLDRFPAIEGMMPDLLTMPAGCPFHPRCSERMDECSIELPPEKKIPANHSVHCFKYS